MRLKETFEREPEPKPENLKKLIETVKQEQADIGFALDVDADRLAIIDEKGNPLGEDMTLCLAVKAMLLESKIQGSSFKVQENVLKIVTNLSTTQALKDVCDQFQAQLILTPIGEINVSKKLMSEKALAGGEGNGGVIIPAIGYGRDSLTGIAIILKYLCESDKKISELASEIPKYEVIKDKIDIPKNLNLSDCYQTLKNEFTDAEINQEDGVKFSFKDLSWVHVRESNTEPIVRIIAEAKIERVKELIQLVKDQL